MILLNPTTATFHTKLAEILYTIGDMPSLLKSRKHYSISLNLSAPRVNTRALYGLSMTCRALLSLPSKQKLPTNEEEISREFQIWVEEKLGERETDRGVISELVKGMRREEKKTTAIGDVD